jgi:hypothetical protein
MLRWTRGRRGAVNIREVAQKRRVTVEGNLSAEKRRQSRGVVPWSLAVAFAQPLYYCCNQNIATTAGWHPSTQSTPSKLGGVPNCGDRLGDVVLVGLGVGSVLRWSGTDYKGIPFGWLPQRAESMRAQSKTRIAGRLCSALFLRGQ